jgi:hypothetical protein
MAEKTHERSTSFTGEAKMCKRHTYLKQGKDNVIYDSHRLASKYRAEILIKEQFTESLLSITTSH